VITGLGKGMHVYAIADAHVFFGWAEGAKSTHALRYASSGVGVAKRVDVARIGLGVRPGIHHHVGTGERRVYPRVAGRRVPDPL
jgi:hypothetical protein